MNSSSYLTELDDNATHIIVWFYNIRRKDEKSCIDLVPREWLIKIKRSWYCKYPSKSEYDKVQEWSKERKIPESTWKYYPIILIKEASNFDEGQRRVARFSEGNVILSSELSDESDESTEECENDTEDRSDVLELSNTETFSHLKIVKRKITEIEENDVSTCSSDNSPSILKNKKSLPSARLTLKENIKRKKFSEKADKNLNTVQQTKLSMIRIENNESSEVESACCEQMKAFLQPKMDSIKRSILYDIRKGFQELQNNLLLNLPRQEEMNPISALRQIIEIKLPTSLEEFDNLDSVMDNDEKKNALRSLLEKYVETHKKAIHDALSSIKSKNVQIQFTAFGRKKRT